VVEALKKSIGYSNGIGVLVGLKVPWPRNCIYKESDANSCSRVAKNINLRIEQLQQESPLLSINLQKVYDQSRFIAKCYRRSENQRA